MFGRRIRKNINGEITKYVYDRENMLLELDQWNNLKAKYLHSGVDQIWRMERKDTPYYDESFQEQYFYFLRDRIGNITEVTNFVGDVVQRYVYDVFGKITIFDGDGNQITASSEKYLENPFTFTGREYDRETGLYYYRARYYDPEVGLFLSEDPIHFAGKDFNLYRYALNNPTTYSDSTGLLVEVCQRPRDWLPTYLNFFPFTHTFLCVQGRSDRFPTCGGQSFFGSPSGDSGSDPGATCTPVDPPGDRPNCFDRCVKRAIQSHYRPGWTPISTCHEYAAGVLAACYIACPLFGGD